MKSKVGGAAEIISCEHISEGVSGIVWSSKLGLATKP